MPPIVATFAPLLPIVGFSLVGLPFFRILLTCNLRWGMRLSFTGLGAMLVLTGIVLSLLVPLHTGALWWGPVVLGTLASVGGLVANSPQGFGLLASPDSCAEVLRGVRQLQAPATGCAPVDTYEQIRGMQEVRAALAEAQEELRADGFKLMSDIRACYVPLGDAEAMFAAVWTSRRSDGFILRSLGRGLEAWGLAPHEAVGYTVTDFPHTARWTLAAERYAQGDMRPFVVVNDESVTAYAPRPRDTGDLIVAVSIPLVGCEVFHDHA